MPWEINFLNGIQSIRSSFLDNFIKIYTNLGSTVAIIAIIVLLLVFKKTRRVGIDCAVTLILGLLLGNLLLKHTIMRQRPYFDPAALVNQMSLIIKDPVGLSFPSGHTIGSFDVAFTIFLNNKKWGTVALIIAATVAFSRMYLFVHFPTDIIEGILVAAIASILTVYIIKPFYKKLADKIA